MTLLDQLHLDTEADSNQGVLLAGPFRKEERAEQSAEVYRNRGVDVELERVERKGWIVVDRPERPA